jgi:peptidoglycan hydrolase-like protein with peptidoglycan-binding domain
MFGKKGSPAARRLVGLLMGLTLVLGVPQAAFAAERAPGAEALARGAGYATVDGAAAVERVQRRLQVLGESPGPVDGLFGPLTEGAVLRLQQRSGLAADGIVGPATRKALRTAQPRPIRRGAGYGVPGGSAQVMALQRRLRAAGLRTGPVDGVYGARTEAAVRRFQRRSRIGVDGVAGPQTYAALDRTAGGETRRTESDDTRAQDERRASAERPVEKAPAPEPARPAAEPRELLRPVAADDDGGGTPWLAIALAAGLAAVLLALVAGRGRLPRRRPPTSVVPLGRGLELEGESSDPAIGRFHGTAYAVEIPEVKDPGERAEGSRFFVIAPGQRHPFWVGYSEVRTPLPPALQAHPAPWAGQRGLGKGAKVLGYATVPAAVPERQAELYDQIARIEGLCKRRRFDLLGVVRDVEPNGEDVLERPGIRYALDRFEEHEADALVVSDVSRLGDSRDQLDSVLARLDEGGIALVAIEPELDTSTQEGRELVHQLEIVRGERTKLGPRKPWRPRKEPLRDRVVELRDEGTSLRGIADALEAEREAETEEPDRKVVPLRPPRRFEREPRRTGEG